MANFLKALLIVLGTLVVLGLGFAGYVYYQLGVPVSEDAYFDIEPGSNLSAISEQLTEGPLPMDDNVFTALALLTRDAGAIQAGQYQLETGMSALEVLTKFRTGDVVQHRITFPEGWTFRQWREAFANAPYLSRVTEELSDHQIAEILGVQGVPEGWLFPDTYQYVRGDTDIEIMALALEKMQNVLAREWTRRGSFDYLTTPYQALILASIIEKETGHGPDRAKIASVFHNRLKEGMRLQSDPTVIYGIADFDGNLTRVHLRTDTPYNSYTRRGLPPTPICSPGAEAIAAALAGSAHSYLYFVARGDGTSQFSHTLEEHNRAVNQYQLSSMQQADQP